MRVVEPPRFRALILGVPTVRCAAQRKDALLGARLLLVASGTAEGRIEPVPVQRLFQRLCLHYVRVHPGAMAERTYAAGHPLLVDVNDEVEAQARRGFVAKPNHVLELPRRIDMQQRERWSARRKGLARQVKHRRRVLADGVEHHRIAELRRHFPNDVDALGLQPVQVAQRHLTFFLQSAAAKPSASAIKLARSEPAQLTGSGDWSGWNVR